MHSAANTNTPRKLEAMLVSLRQWHRTKNSGKIKEIRSKTFLSTRMGRASKKQKPGERGGGASTYGFRALARALFFPACVGCR